jgi:hypothetical protein
MKITMALFVLLTSVNLMAQDMDCETEKVSFEVKKITSRLKNTDLTEVIAETPITKRIMHGQLAVYKVCTDSAGNGLKVKKITIPTHATYELKGIALRGGSLGILPNNTEITILNYRGKQLKETINKPFVGAKIAATLGLGIAVNPNFSGAVNSNGLILSDIESLMGLGPTVAAGVTIARLKVQFYPKFERVNEEDNQLLELDL